MAGPMNRWEETLWAQQLEGPVAKLRPWLEDPAVTDILIQGTAAAFVDRAGILSAVPPPFADREEWGAVIERLITPLQTGIDAARPYLDGRLSDGSRFHLVLSPIAVGGPFLSIRKFSSILIPLEKFGTQKVVEWLRESCRERKNILVSGATGTGKTTLLAALLAEVSAAERVVILEETRELPIAASHLVYLEARMANADGRGAVTLRDLVRNSLRMRPDRLVVGECRGEEAFDLLQALATGHQGSLATIHARSALGALSRLEALVLLARPTLTLDTVRRWVAGSIDAVVHLQRLEKHREISEVITLAGTDSGQYIFAPVFPVL